MGMPIFPQEPQVDDVRPWLDGIKGKKIQPKDIDPKMLKELMEKVQNMPKDQKPDQKQIEEMLEKNPQFKDPAFLEQLKKLVENQDFPGNLDQKFPNEKLPPIDNGPDTKEKIEQVIKTAQDQPPPIMPKGGDGPKLDGKVPELPKDGIDPTTPKSQAADNEWVKWMQKNFGDSPAANDAVKDLVKAMENKNGKGMFDDIPEFKNGGWKDFDKWGKSNAGDLWKTKPPDLGGTTSPKIGNSSGPNWGSGGGGGGGSSSWGSGGGGAGGGGFGGGGSALAIIAGIAGAILLAVILFRKWKMNQAERANQVHGGPLPIDFEAIRSREQLVRVFNKVSLDQIGTDARSWNHRVVADHFVESKPVHAGPAGEVAGLYERARYAPDDEDLSGGEFSIARRDLRLLAGVPA
jgi:hypothetical protein